ncbi:MAG TPA: glycosyltransferase family 4 protein [Bryobacteraceae bacterium]|nr:glycosyltransferase family 4 protein [Bryobacteraceae bacterium]
MNIAVFDYRVVPTNPVGSCHLRMLSGLCDRHNFTVFAVEFQNPSPEKIRWVRIPLPLRPYVLLFALFHLAAPVAYAIQRLRGTRFDLVQMVESNLSFGDISYAHFCHRMYLARHWRETKARGLRGFLRGLAHRAAALMEPAIYRRVRHVIAPSRGLVAELSQTYPVTQAKIRVLPNSVDVDRLQPPGPEERRQLRQSHGYSPEHLVLVFVALGHFERKGLPLVFEAMKETGDDWLKLVVVGGERSSIAEYRARARTAGVAGRVRFAGMQRDLRPHYWAADAFILPSCYEVFPLVALEAAAAGLPLLVTRVNGVEEFLRDGENGLAIDRVSASVARAIRRFSAMPAGERRQMGVRARETVMQYGRENFVSAWRSFYDAVV